MIDETTLRKMLSDRNLRAVAARADIDYQALRRFAAGLTKKPSAALVDRLRGYLSGS